ncbi:MAG: CpsB/CapC family capsule biosynthesis tyrosine phosphatase [Longimicrobiales bacterium]
MSGFTEFHNHLLPAADDGARSMDETVRHLQAFARDGTTTLVFSPHLFGSLSRERGALDARLEELRDIFEHVRQTLAGRDDVPALMLGHEVLLTDPAMARAVVGDRRVGHAGANVVLIEFGFQLPDACIPIIQAVSGCGRTPLIAHPERFRRDHSPVSLAEIRTWKSAGALLQVNGGSVTGRYSPAVRTLAHRLLAEGLADVIGSDNHADARPQLPGEVWLDLADRDGTEQAGLLLAENPARLLRDEPTLPVPPLATAAVG